MFGRYTNILPFLASSKINSKIELLLLCNGNISLRCCCWSQFQDEYMMFVMGHTSNRDTRSVMCTVVRKFILFFNHMSFQKWLQPCSKIKTNYYRTLTSLSNKSSSMHRNELYFRHWTPFYVIGLWRALWVLLKPITQNIAYHFNTYRIRSKAAPGFYF